MRFRSGTPCLGLIGLIGVVLLLGSARARAQDSLGANLWNVSRGQVPHETALGLYTGKSYDWTDMYFFLASFQALFEHGAIWPFPSPEGLKIRFEGNVGTAVGTDFPGARLVTSGNFLAVYEFGAPQTARLVPYVEAGAGVIYTDFQREGQGSRVNFNPVAGIGLRTKKTFITLRAHHVSNAGLNDENRGINSVVLGFGVYLGSN